MPPGLLCPSPFCLAKGILSWAAVSSRTNSNCSWKAEYATHSKWKKKKVPNRKEGSSFLWENSNEAKSRDMEKDIVDKERSALPCHLDLWIPWGLNSEIRFLRSILQIICGNWMSMCFNDYFSWVNVEVMVSCLLPKYVQSPRCPSRDWDRLFRNWGSPCRLPSVLWADASWSESSLLGSESALGLWLEELCALKVAVQRGHI